MDMTPAAIIDKLSAAGVHIQPDAGRLKVVSTKPLTDAQREWLREQKRVLLAYLSAVNHEDIHEAINERAAIQEFEGGLSRPEAEQAARRRMQVYRYRLRNDPHRWLILIAPGCDLADAQSALTNRFGTRVVAVEPYLPCILAEKEY